MKRINLINTHNISITKIKKLNNKILLMEKNELLNFISLTVGKNITFVKCIYIGNRLRFGNKMKTIYKITGVHRINDIFSNN